MKIIDINKDYKKLCNYAETVFSDRDYDNSFYWFDRKKYKFIPNEHFKKNNDKTRYIKFILFDFDYSLIDYYLSRIEDKKVHDYFSSIYSIEELSLRFRKFIDWNCIQTDFDIYDAITDEIVKWCETNRINYKFQKKAAPNDYPFLKENLSKITWEIPN